MIKAAIGRLFVSPAVSPSCLSFLLRACVLQSKEPVEEIGLIPELATGCDDLFKSAVHEVEEGFTLVLSCKASLRRNVVRPVIA